MNKFLTKTQVALKGEDGGPNIETIIGISVALIVATALIALGTLMASWIGNAQNVVNGFKTT